MKHVINKIYKTLIVTVFAIMSAGVSPAQDPQFSQYYASGLFLNPSLVGSENNLTFKSNYRNQWRTVTLPYVSSQVSIIYPWLKGNEVGGKHIGGIGVSFYNDKAGDGMLKTLGVAFSGAYTLHLGTGTSDVLVFGLQGGFIQKQLDYTNLEWGEQFNRYLGFDPTLSPNENNVMASTFNEDISTGLIWYHNSARNYEIKTWSGFFGLSAYHLTRPDESMLTNNISRLPILYKMHAGIEIHVAKHFNISPNVLAMMQQGNQQINFGGYLDYNLYERTTSNLTMNMELIAGLWYRLGDAFIFLAGIQNDYYTLGFSFDMNTSQLRRETGGRGAYEVSLSIRRVRERKRLKFSTPRI